MHDPEERREAQEKYIKGLEDFALAMAPIEEGPFFLGGDFSAVDICLVPWWQRQISVLAYYRGFVSPANPRFTRLEQVVHYTIS
jgi:glutathione S-transferase